MPRALGSVLASLLNDENLYYWEFLRIQWGGSLGTTHWTTFPGDKFWPNSIDVDLGWGTSLQTWDCVPIWTPGDYEQGESPLSISDIYFGNADNQFNETYVLGREGGTMGANALLLYGFFQKYEPDPYITARPFEGSFVVYDGLLDRAEVMGDWVHVSLLPGSHPLDQQVPRRRYTSAWGFAYLPKPNFKITFPNGQTYTAPPPTRSQTGDNSPGGGNVSPPDDIGNTGGGPTRGGTRSVNPRNPGPPSAGGGRSPGPTPTRGDPRTVDR
jgi:hypothetical protein